MSFLDRYDQSLDWVVRGDPEAMICSRAAGSPAAAVTQTANPIFALIEQHRAAEIAFREAVRVEFAMKKNEDAISKLKFRQRRAYEGKFEQLREATSDTGDRNCDLLVTTTPTTLAGVAALCCYLGQMFSDVEEFEPARRGHGGRW